MSGRGRILRIKIAVFLALLPCLACVATDFQKPVAMFQQSVQESSSLLADYYNGLNQFTRDSYLENRLYNPELSLADSINPPGQSPLTGKPFSPDVIAAKVGLVNRLGDYGRLLGELAGSQAPAAHEKTVQELAGSFQNLHATFQGLASSDSQALNYAGPLGSLAGLLGRLALEHERDKALTLAIAEGTPAVRTLLEVMHQDMEEVVGPQRRGGLALSVSRKVSFYDHNRQRLTFDERRQILADINQSVQKNEAFQAQEPVRLLDCIGQAHEALVKYAASDRQPENLAQLTEAMTLFSQRVNQIAKAIKELRS